MAKDISKTLPLAHRRLKQNRPLFVKFDISYRGDWNWIHWVYCVI